MIVIFLHNSHELWATWCNRAYCHDNWQCNSQCFEAKVNDEVTGVTKALESERINRVMQFVGALKPDSVIKWRKYSYCDKCCSKYLQSLKIIWSLNHLLTWLFYRVRPYSAPLILYDSYFMTCTQEYRTICKMNNLKNIWTCQTFIKFSLICMSRAWLLHNLIEALLWCSHKGFWRS